MAKKESKDADKNEGVSAKENAPRIRREIFNMETLNILLSSIILVVLLIGPGMGVGASSSDSPAFTSDETACRTFCEYNPQYGTGLFAGISDDGHCLCRIDIAGVSNYAMNKTLSATIILDQGIIITDAILTDGVPDISDSLYYDTG